MTPPRIVHVQALDSGVVLHLDRISIEEELDELLFGDGRPGGVLLTQWQGRFEQWRLILTREALGKVSEEVRDLYLLPSMFSRAEAEGQQARDRRAAERHEQWLDTFNPVLGRSPREALQYPGWFERNGHFVWIGRDPHEWHESIQIVPLSQSRAQNEHIRYYLAKGLSLLDAIRHISEGDHQLLKAAALAAAGWEDLALAIVEAERQKDQALDEQRLVAEIDADRVAIEAAIREAIARMGEATPTR